MSDDIARRRFLMLTAMRFGGIIIAIAGIVIWRQGLFGFQDETIGKLVLAVGLFDALVLPAILRRRWRSDRGDGN